MKRRVKEWLDFSKKDLDAVDKLHDLIRLYERIPNLGIKLTLDEDMLDSINDVYIESRYPSDIGLLPKGIPSVGTVQDFYNFALSINEEVTGFLRAA